jgi:hypothetical protein
LPTLTLTSRHIIRFVDELDPEAGLAGRDPATVEIQELLPAIFAAVPDASIPEISEALRWGSRQCSIEADKLERRRNARRTP